MNQSTPQSVRLPHDLDERMRVYCEKKYLPHASFVRQAIAEKLEREEEYEANR